VSADADRLNAHPGTFFIAKQRIDQGELDALDRAVAPHGSIVVRSLFRNERDVTFKRYAYASFREGHLEAIEPLMDDSEVEALSHLPRFEFDSPSESFDGWKDAETHSLGGSMLHVITSDPDSYLAVPIAPFAPWLAGSVSIRMRVTRFTDCPSAHADGALFWVTETDRSWGARDKLVPFSVVTDGEWHEIRLDLSDHAAWSGSGVIRELRFDPLHCVGTMDLDYFRIE
jgi:hypothetical protein